jgi:hypothetical protein
VSDVTAPSQRTAPSTARRHSPAWLIPALVTVGSLTVVLLAAFAQ